MNTVGDLAIDKIALMENLTKVSQIEEGYKLQICRTQDQGVKFESSTNAFGKINQGLYRYFVNYMNWYETDNQTVINELNNLKNKCISLIQSPNKMNKQERDDFFKLLGGSLEGIENLKKTYFHDKPTVYENLKPIADEWNKLILNAKDIYTKYDHFWTESENKFNHQLEGLKKYTVDKQSDQQFRKIKKDKYPQATFSSNFEEVLPPASNEHIQHAKNQAIRIQKEIGKDYYVFTHAQQGDWLFVSLLIKELNKIESPSIKAIPFQKYFRHSKDIKSNFRVESTICDLELSKELISADSYLKNDAQGESAEFFLTQANINSSEQVKKVINELIRYYARNDSIFNKLNTRALEIIKKYRLSAVTNKNPLPSMYTKVGHPRSYSPYPNLAVFCVPKQQIDEVGYLSLPYGKKVQYDELQKHADSILILEKQQEGKFISLNLKESINYKNMTTPQFRLYTHALNNPGVRSFFISFLPEEQYRSLKREVEQLAQSIYRQKIQEDQLKEMNCPLEWSQPALSA